MIDISESRLTVPEAAALLNVTPRTVHKYFRRGLRHHAYSRKNVITSKEALQEFGTDNVQHVSAGQGLSRVERDRLAARHGITRRRA